MPCIIIIIIIIKASQTCIVVVYKCHSLKLLVNEIKMFNRGNGFIMSSWPVGGRWDGTVLSVIPCSLLLAAGQLAVACSTPLWVKLVLCEQTAHCWQQCVRCPDKKVSNCRVGFVSLSTSLTCIFIQKLTQKNLLVFKYGYTQIINQTTMYTICIYQCIHPHDHIHIKTAAN